MAGLIPLTPARGAIRTLLRAAQSANPFVVITPAGRRIPLLSVEACRAEFRHLRRVGHEIDLAGPARQMTGWQHEVPETQWPFMQFCYFGNACLQLAEADPESREAALAEVRWLIEALQTPRLSGFVTGHFGPPFGPEFRAPSVFVHGLFLNLAVRYRQTSGDRRFDTLLHRVAGALAREFRESGQGILPTYRGMVWPTDNLPALAGLVRYDAVFGSRLADVRTNYVEHMRAHYLDDHGLLASYVDLDGRQVLQGARGVGMGYALHFLRDVDPDLAAKQYARFRRLFFREALGLAAVREFPEGAVPAVDVDSGMVIFGLGTAASGFAIGACAVMGDAAAARELLRSSILAGGPVWRDEELSYAAMPPVGQAVILFAKTALLKPGRSPNNALNPADPDDPLAESPRAAGGSGIGTPP